MDFSESTKIVYDRIQKIDPENVSKIVGYLLLQDHGEREMIRLAYCPDNLIHSLINKAKTHLKLPSNIPEMPLHFTPFTPSTRHSPLTIQIPSQPVDYVPMVYPASFPEDYRLHNHLRFLSLEDQIDSVNTPDFSPNNFYNSSEPSLGPRANRRSPSLPEFPFKVCHYFIKGFCRHGNNCRYLHPTSESFSYIEDDNVFSPGSLDKLELELTELLKSRRGFPLSIASLPMLYYEKFGKSLQAEGYLTESQRHGKAGYSLTKLLARLKSICLIDRPHGQHAVILADDLAKCMDHNGDRDRNEHGGIVAGSRQIYLTFPAESTFSERDVFNYFNKFGPVHDVRIPCQQKRMFGFVTFVFADTVRHILNKGNPHFVSGARVLVKPYREKSKADESMNLIRKHGEAFQNSIYQGGHGLDSEIGLQSMPRICDNSRLIKKQIIEEQQEQALEFERRHFSEMQLSADLNNQFPSFRTTLEELRLPEGNSHAPQMNFRSTEHFNYLLDYLNNGPSNDERIRQINTKYNEESSQGLNLPDSPFAAALGGEISTVI
ncbi:zinc finger CCCH domain-containing protein 18 isoform X1 [Lactuca sativa]|uniref:zinc finger CCCH domain-containing protein 18 isoform X1 n=1 Tax=Lactuca sativa TaxID=4236 RepID=UPI000CD996D3|nr:zinc finger CCCH domain-containing protein 18 isoform X1 [Lactuca sativa]XP_042752180.1 zinc finger CCCH domain-containing protein 18 isoform X1 [Lactuca sativa]